MVLLDYRDSRPIYVQIMEGLRGQIRAGVLLPGDKLPSVRELAAKLSINPNTIQRAYRDLEREGWILSVPGKGSFVCDSPGPVPGERESLLSEFEETVKKLLAAGISPEELIGCVNRLRGDLSC